MVYIYGHAYIYTDEPLTNVVVCTCWGGKEQRKWSEPWTIWIGASNPRWKHHGTQHTGAPTLINYDFIMFMEQRYMSRLLLGLVRSGKTVVWSNVTGTTGWWTMELTNQLDISLIQIWFWLCFDDWDSHVFSLSSPSFLKVRAKDFL